MTEVLDLKKFYLNKNKEKLNQLIKDKNESNEEKIKLNFEYRVVQNETKKINQEIQRVISETNEINNQKNILLNVVQKNKVNLQINRYNYLALCEEFDKINIKNNLLKNENEDLLLVQDNLNLNFLEKEKLKNELLKKLEILQVECEVNQIRNSEQEEILLKLELEVELISNMFSNYSEQNEVFLEKKEHSEKTIFNYNQSLIQLKNQFEIQERMLFENQKMFEDNCKKIDELSFSLNQFKTDISKTENSIKELKEKLIKSTEEFQKLRDLEIIANLTLDHLLKEEKELCEKIEITNENNQKKNTISKNLNEELKIQNAELVSLKKNEFNLLVQLFTNELILKTEKLIKINSNYLNLEEKNETTLKNLTL